MLTNLSVASAYQDRLLVNVSGIETLSEVIHRNTDGPSSSSLIVTFSGVQISGMISYLFYQIYDGDVWGTNNVYFLAVPSGLDTIKIGSVTYTFVAVLSGINNVPLKNTPEEQAVALFRVVNAQGTSGTDFYAGQSFNPGVSGVFPDNPLTFRTTLSGILGNSLSITTTSKAIQIVNAYFSGARDYQVISPLFFGSISSGINSKGNGTYTLQDLPYSSIGEMYLVKTWFTNSGQLQALDPAGNLSSYWYYTPFFEGRTSLPYYAEVSGLSSYSLYSGKIPSNGVMGLQWSNVNTLYARNGISVKLAYPNASGVQTQASGVYSYAVQGQKFDYVIFVFQAYSGSAPQASWPRPVDANGVWYYAGKTGNTSATLYLPPESTSTFSVWVGFGNKDTRGTSGLPFNSYSRSIYIR
jgi:hypothetical protein